MTRLSTLLLLLVLALPAVAQDTPTTPADMDDVTLFRTFCKGCHSSESEAGEYSPMDLIMDQWDEVFDAFDENHAEAITLEATEGKPVGQFLGEKLLDRLRAFCIKGAADSEEPMTCG